MLRELPNRDEQIEYILDSTRANLKRISAEQLRRLANAVGYCKSVPQSKRRNYQEKNYFIRRAISKTFEDYMDDFRQFLSSLNDIQVYIAYEKTKEIEEHPLDQ
ncbi:unnamed protein product [Rotaria magnacalcarata]|uniref:Uncharacterized protein n=1 Tax=Rotaria magnacalcarata TaxID=392030 RepID=A0A820NZ51_9BILA|nr:unnamed protein product [Rotaria magnacalcarata]CAF4396517.1 unnamed protein product [Rotaria magnacalcarata]